MMNRKQHGVYFFGLSIFLILFIFLSGCANLNWRRNPATAADHYYYYAQSQLQPYFQRAHVQYPPKAISLLAFKHSHQLELWAKNRFNDDWKYIRTFPILAASGGPGPKLRQGDRQVPEGIYSVVRMNPH